jgi:hypothetical protein
VYVTADNIKHGNSRQVDLSMAHAAVCNPSKEWVLIE